MRFICLGYADEKTWDAMSPKEQSDMMDECLAFDEVLHKGGHVVAVGDALQSSRTAKTLRLKNGKVMVTDGPFAETKEQLGGFFVFEARDMNHAIELMSNHPCVPFGPLEIRPADEQINALVAEKHERLKDKTKRQSKEKKPLFQVAAVRYQVKDVARSVAFYTQHLGFKLEMQSGPAFAKVSNGSFVLWLSGPQSSGSRPMPDGRKQEPGGWNRIALEVEDLPSRVAELKKAGLRFRNEIEAGPGGKQIQLEDPDGNPVELFEPAS